MTDKNKEQNFISAVIYVRNNEENILNFLQTINNYLKENFVFYEMIFVNDASEDSSVSKIKSFVAENNIKTTSIINMSYFQGTEKSMLAGIDLSIGDFVYDFDTTDISYPGNILEEVYKKCLTGFDIVSASPVQKSGNDLFYKVYNNILNCQYKLKNETFRIISRRVINRIQTMSISIPFRKTAYAKCGLKTSSVEYTPVKNLPKLSSEEKKIQNKNAFEALILYTDIAYKIAKFLVCFTAASAIFTAVYTIYMYLTIQPVEGWTSTLLFISFGFFAITLLLAIIIKYSSLILDTVFNKNKYVIEIIEKI